MIRGQTKSARRLGYETKVGLIGKKALRGSAKRVIAAGAEGAARALGAAIASSPLAASSVAPSDQPPAVEMAPTTALELDAVRIARLSTGTVPRRARVNKPVLTAPKPAREKRYLDLAVFVGRGPIPPSAIEALLAPEGIPSAEVAGLVDELLERSIVQRTEGGLIVVGGGIGADGAGSGVGARGLAAAHRRLVDGYRSRCPDGSWSKGPNDGYFFENLAYHLIQAGRAQELHRLLLDYDWLRTRLAASGVTGLLADFSHRPLPAEVEAVDEALALAAVDLAGRPDHLASQLAGRLAGLSSPGIDRLLGQICDRAPRPWICPLTPALPSPGGPLDRAVPRHDGVVRAVAVTPDGSRLVSGSDDHTVRIWDLTSGKLELTLEGHADSVRAVAITPDGRRIISGGTFDALRVWDLEGGHFVHTLVGQNGCRAVYAVAVTPDGGRVVSGGAGSTVQVWDLAGGRLERTLRSEDQAVRTVAITPDGRFALSGGDGGKVHVWDLANGRLVRDFNSHAGTVFAVAVAPDGSRVVSCGHNNTVQVWDFATGRPLRTLCGHTGAVNAVAVTQDGRRIVSGGSDRKVSIWDLAGGQKIASWTLDGDTLAMAVCPVPTDAARVAYGDSAGGVQVLRLLEA